MDSQDLLEDLDRVDNLRGWIEDKIRNEAIVVVDDEIEMLIQIAVSDLEKIKRKLETGT
jgi:hypothetical protein